MAAIAAGNVTYTEQTGQKVLTGMPPRYRNVVNVAFGDGALTYPTDGVPLTLSGLGLTQSIESLEVDVRTVAAGENNPHWIWNGSTTSPKLLGFNVPANASETYPAEVANTYAPTAQALKLVAVGF